LRVPATLQEITSRMAICDVIVLYYYGDKVCFGTVLSVEGEILTVKTSLTTHQVHFDNVIRYV
jgi:hypothetical protein